MNTPVIQYFESLYGSKDSTIGRDLKLNIKRILEGEFLNAEETNLALLALGSSLGDQELVNVVSEQLALQGYTAEQILETKESAALMAMLNTYYKFRKFVADNLGESEREAYKLAKLRMNALARPVLGKEKFEFLALGISVLNGCESCVVSHEKACRDAGVTTEKIHEMARLASVLKGLDALKN